MRLISRSSLRSFFADQAVSASWFLAQPTVHAGRRFWSYEEIARLPCKPWQADGQYAQSTPPMGILCLAAYLRSRLDVDLCLMDQRVENASVETVVQRPPIFGADVVGLSVMTPYSSNLGPDGRTASGDARGIHCAGRAARLCFRSRSIGGQCGGRRRAFRGRRGGSSRWSGRVRRGRI